MSEQKAYKVCLKRERDAAGRRKPVADHEAREVFVVAGDHALVVKLAENVCPPELHWVLMSTEWLFDVDAQEGGLP